jgi:hypothetical protein
MLKLLAFVSTVCCINHYCQSQRCLDMPTAIVCQKVNLPSSPRQAFDDCEKAPSTRKALFIKNYGANYAEVESFIKQKEIEFSQASMVNMNANMPSNTQIEDAQKLAEKIESMSDEQKKAYAMQIAQQQMSSATTQMMQQNEGSFKMLIETVNLQTKLDSLYRFAYFTKITDIMKARKLAQDQIVVPDETGCPSVDKVEFPGCKCVNAFYTKIFLKKVNIDQKYVAQLLHLYQEFLPQIKALCTQIDYNIAQLKMGDALNLVDNKKKLLGIQASAFSCASLVFGIETEIRKTADIYVDYYNASNNSYAGSCDVDF